MEIVSKRMWPQTDTVISELSIDDQYECYILEDKPCADGVKQEGCCIPPGLALKVARVFSPHFQMEVPILYTDLVGKGDTPDDYIIKDHAKNIWDAVEFHPGNSAKDTRGCQLPGTAKDLVNQQVHNSRIAFKALRKKIFSALASDQEVTYLIINSTPDQAHDYKK